MRSSQVVSAPATTRRTYVLDTSVLLAAGSRAFRVFAEHAVVLPISVIGELEAKRNDPDHGWIAREVLRTLEDLRTEATLDGRTLRDEISVNEEGGTLRIEFNHVDRTNLPPEIKHSQTRDVRVMAVAAALHDERRQAVEGAGPLDQAADGEIVLVSRDLPMRLVAGGVLGLKTEDYRNDQVPETGYTGISHLEVGQGQIDRLYDNRELDPGEAAELPLNTAVVLSNGASGSALTVLKPDRKLHLIRQDQQAFGVKGRSAEQRIAIHHLLEPSVGIVSLGGPAGTGKTMLALAAGLDAVMERDEQERVVVFRPMYSVGGQDLGFLPGSEEEKMAPWAAAVYDALDAIVGRDKPGRDVRDEIEARGLLEVLPLTHIRGRTLTNSFIIIDEAQNLERPVLLSALSRLGEGSRVVLCGDVAQRDNLHVGRYEGIATVVERLKGQALFAHVTLTRSERSPIAELVTALLDGD
jgi:PhoH-like ATPase